MMIVIAPSEIKDLRSKFPVEAHSIRQGHSNNAKTKCAWFVYLDRIAIIDRLDELFPGEWEYTMTEPLLRDKHYSAIGSLTIRGITRQFNGTQKSGSFTPGDDEKGCGTDVFRRTASMWGIGSYLYNAPNIWTALPAKNDWDAQRKYEAEAKAIFTRWFNSGDSPPERNTGQAQSFWTEENKNKLYGYWQGQGLTRGDVLRLAGISDANDPKQWARYTKASDASAAIQAAWNTELDIDKEQGPPDPASEYDGSLDEPPTHNGYVDTFHWMSFIGKKSNLQFSTHEPDMGHDEYNTTAVCYGGRSAITEWGGKELHEQLALAQYDKIKGKNITSRFIKMVAPIEFYFEDDQSNSDFDFKVTGIKGDPVIPY